VETPEQYSAGRGRDHRRDGSDDAALAGTAGSGRVFRSRRPAHGQGEWQSGSRCDRANKPSGTVHLSRPN